MSFNSIDFLIFLPVVLVLYFILPAKVKNLWLLAASYYFYMCWNAKYALLILTSTLMTWLSGIILEKIKESVREEARKTALKKATVALCLVINLGILFVFKYYNFAAETLTALFERIGIRINLSRVDLLLPVGISFYTFQALSYTMDVYRDEIYAEKNFLRYALFVSFFPQLVAGPIERSKNLLKQLAKPHRFSFERVRDGLLLMLWGFFLKIVIADRAAIFVDTVYGNYTGYPGWYLVVATVLFAVQIYCDFYGYSTIAMGAAKMLGIRLMENFNAPYLSGSVAEFWRNWHISLTSWFKDYLYIPLGGSRKGKARKYINKMIVFLVSGLWHGAKMTFVIWGGLNGLYQIFGEITKPFRDRIVNRAGLHRKSAGHRVLQVLITFTLITFSWIFFRADNFAASKEIIRSIFTTGNIHILFDNSLYGCGLDVKNFRLLEVSILVLVFADICKRRGIVIRDVIARQDRWVRCLFITAVICAILLFGLWGPAFDKASFIYFQF